MRKSRYAIEASGPAGELLLFNAANGAFAVLDEEAGAAWKEDRAQGEEAAVLAQQGFLTELSADEEFGLQQAAFDGARADTSLLTLSFIPTYVCNYRCPYCYELGHNKVQGRMDERTMDAVMHFVARRHEIDSLERLSVQWYGGDPSLALDAVDALTQRLIAWCEERGIAYEAMMLTNANVVDDAAADIIARCRITTVMLTIDGPEDVHNRRRIAANGTNSYQRTIQAARRMRARGVHVFANMNIDKVSLPYFEDLRRTLLEEEGIVLSMAKMNDYGSTFGAGAFCEPDFDLFTHEEFSRVKFEEFAKSDHSADEMREMLRPLSRFCTGQADNYFVIDLLGDVYHCDGWVGDKDYVRFNLFDDESTWRLHEVVFDATRDEKCRDCELLPLCLGNCIWERSCCGMPCHPFMTTIGDYLRVYRACFGDIVPNGVTVLADAFTPAELGRAESLLERRS